jgi:imidazolonepropionase-like amidohydrolase
MNRHFVVLPAFFLLTCVVWLSAQKPLRPTVYAITNARVIAKPDEILSSATVVIRDGLIEAVGEKVTPPADAVVIDGRGKTVCAGFIDGLSNLGFDSTLRKSSVGDPAPVDLASEALANTRPDHRRGLTPDFQVRAALKADDYAPWRSQGVTARLIAPDGGILLGQSALISLSGETPRTAVLNGAVAQHLAFRSPGGTDYPRVLMGFVAHARQIFYDAGFHQRQLAAFTKGGGVGKRPAADPALEALTPALEGKMPVVIEADRRDDIERALDFAAEFKLNVIVYGGQDAWKLSKRLAKEKVPVILRVDFGPERSEREVPQRVREEQARKRKQEIECASVLFRDGVTFALASQGQPGEDPAAAFRKAITQVVDAGLPSDAALAAVTTVPARLFGVSGQVGEIAKGRAAHVVLFEGALFSKDMKIRDVFVDGVRFEIDESKPGKTETPQKDAPQKDAPKKDGVSKVPPKKDDQPKDDPKKDDPKKDDKTKPAPEYATELDADRKPAIQTKGNVLLRNATVHTAVGPAQANMDILVEGGKIKAIGKKLPAKGVKELDCTGMHITPGIIDTHCHFAISGGVNEFSLSIVPEVRVRDVISSEDVQIFRALAGGVTTARLLHGSANVIGGQDAVLKMKWGRSAKEMLVTDGPRGVKFALGENVKRTEGRFPNTRLGVEAVLIRAFTEAQEYAQKWRAFKAGTGPEIRRDLRLEALAEVLSGEIKIHCHCYRSDEILMLLRVCERFGVRVASLQHVLEGYKVAPEIASHGASCSPFSDWWAYKWEAADAIPHCAALLHETGISVAIKSDSNELMRHLYHEAAKTIKHGNMDELEALRTITLNGAKQLGIASRTGSIEEGKDADLAIFNGHPFNGYARVELTLVEGEVYFQRSKEWKGNPIAQAGPAPRLNKLGMPPRTPEGRYVLVGATVHTGVNVLKNATVVIDRGRITAVRETNPGEKGIPAAGLHLYPGMIDAGSILGLIEIDSARETRDHAESGDFQPDLRALTGVNPDSELIPVTRSNGILSVLTRPTGGVIAGQSAVINLAGWTPKDMAVADPLGLHIELPGGVPGIGRGSPFGVASRAVLRKQREAKIKQLRELFGMAVRNPAGNPRLEALAPYARGEKPVIIQASRREEILEALKLADELKIKIILSGGIDAWKVAEDIKKRDIPVILGPVMSLPYESTDPFDAPYTCAAKLHAAGVRFCLRSQGDSNTRNLPYQAAMAVAYGLPPEEGLRAVTLYPAQILGVADELGILRAGKRANLVITNGDILQATTQVVGSFIDGKPYAAEDKQTRLYERYRERIREYKSNR